MRTKALVCAAALAAGAVSTMAQSNVYSLNVVGYVNVTLTNGYNLIANQLDADGYMTNNTVLGVFSTNMPNLTKVYAFDPAAQTFNAATYSAGTQKWGGNVTAANGGLVPGQGVFVQIPAAATTPITLTMVGQVIQGTYTQPIVPGLQVCSAIAPLSTGVQTGLGYKPTRLDKVQQYDSGVQTFVAHTYNGSTWSGGEPTPKVGEAFFYSSTVATNWTQSFTVSQ